MRANLRSSTCEIVLMSSVLARPGTPTMRLLPPVNNESSTSSITSSWPMISLCSSLMIESCPALRRSARAMSSCDSSAGVCRVVAKIFSLVSQRVNHVVDAQLVRLVRRGDRHEAGRRVLPGLADVVVHVRDEHQPLLGIVVLVDPPIARRTRAVRRRPADRLVQIHVEERMEDRFVPGELHPLRLG